MRDVQDVLQRARRSMINGHHVPHCFSAHVPGHGYVNDGSILASRPDYLRQLDRAVESEIDNMGYAPGYANGSDDDRYPRGVLLANWNLFPRDFDRLLERMGYACEWSDMYSTCDDCHKAIETEPTSYHWRPKYVIDEGSIICADCQLNDVDSIEARLLNDPDVADTLDVDWQARGFRKLNPDHAYESGLHPGQNDRPTEIAKLVPAGHDFLFAIPSVGQFDVAFDCWIRPIETDDDETDDSQEIGQ